MQDLSSKLALIHIYLSGVWNKKRYIMLSMWIICFLGWVGVSTMPNKYESSAKVHADTKNILKPLLVGLAVQGDTDEELMVISKTLLSRPNLEAIARQTDMHIDYNTPETYERMLKRLAVEIQIKGNKSKVYEITYQHSDPNMAKKIVEATLQKFTDSIAGQTRKENNTATGFLNEQIQDLRERLVVSEQALADFQRENQSSLPNQSGNYYQRISGLATRVEELDYLIKEKEAGIKTLKARFNPSANKQEGVELPFFNVTTQYDERISQLKTALDQLRIKYTEKHPNIIEIIDRIATLEKRRVNEQKGILALAIDGVAQSNDGQNNALQQLSLMIAQSTSEKSVLASRRDNAMYQLDRLKEQLNLVPVVEAELIALTRDYDVINTSYSNLLTRKESAELSSDVNKDTNSVNFNILEPPLKALFPEGPPRIILYAMILIFAVAIGVSVSFVVSQMSAVISSPTHLLNIIGPTPLIGQIEHTQVEKKKRITRFKTLGFFISTLGLLLVFAGLVAHEIIYGQSLMMWL